MRMPEPPRPSEKTLVPNSGIQFIVYRFDLNAVNAFKLPFIERPYPAEQSAPDVPWRLLQAWNDIDPEDEPPNSEQSGDEAYDINKNQAIEAFIGQWVPVPYLRRLPGRDGHDNFNYEKGPSNWARLMIVADDENTDGEGLWYKAIFAIDTNIAFDDDEPAEDAGITPYTSPRSMDVSNPCEFHFVSRMRRIGWFLSDPIRDEADGSFYDFQLWVAKWLEELFLAHKTEKAKGRQVSLRYKLEHVARWIALLELLQRTIAPAHLRFVDTISPDSSVRPVDVDLILDVGNSRTCGMLIENYPNEDSVELNNSLILRLRDISEPWKTYDEPFESHVALSQASFGSEDRSRESGRARAFFWPSMVRVGPEAARIKAKEAGAESIVGMSSPKRYLWDVSAINQPWRFPRGDYSAENELPLIGRTARRFVNANGDVLSQVSKDGALFEALYPKARKTDYTRPARQLSYSRSSFYAFMLMELFAQALVMINDPEVRGERRQSETPRRLKRIILTLPTALPVREQQIMKMRAESAINFLWDIMGWTENPPPGVSRPIIQVSWDEASCVQMVWLYGEISRRFGGRIREYFTLAGKPRPRFSPDQPPAPDTSPTPSLRVASLDIGGGTTDLMVTTFFEEDDRAIVPVQTFREGVRIAGDDITQAVIERCIIPPIENALKQSGLADARTVMRDLFQGDRANMAEQMKHARRQFVLQVLLPAALGLMASYEESGTDRYETVETAQLGQLIRDPSRISPAVLNYANRALPAGLAEEFDLMAVEIPLDFARLANAVRETMEVVFNPISEALAHFDCDYVLLSGRPSKLPAVQEMLRDQLFIGPDRLLPMNRYRAGNWYPFRSRDNTSIGDPKSCAVVGGVLCALSERSIPNFMLYTHLLQTRSTTAYIGEVEKDMKLLDRSIMFSPSDDAKAGSDREKTLKLYTESLIGYRQLPYERWVTSPLYHLRLDDTRPPRPIMVLVSRDQIEEMEDDESPDVRAQLLMRHEGTKEDLRIIDAMDANGADVQRSVSLTFRTFPLSQGDYWLDSGILTV
ncbi:UNVERIFIED_ORG: hypothetical protein BCL66_105243 [Martelella mediterranea]